MTAQAEIKIKADPRELPTGLRAALKMVQGFVHQTTGLMDPKKRGLDYKSIAFGSAVGSIAGNFTMRGIDFMLDQGKQVFDFNKELIRFGIDLRKMPGEMEGIGKGIRKISDETGLGAMEVLKAGRAYADLAGAEAFTMEKMALISRAAQASGADVSDMSQLLFTLSENMKVPPGDLEEALGGLINQAKDGSIHFKELSKELVALGPVYSQFGVTGRQGAIQLGAMMQVARRGFGSASEAGTGVLRILRSLPQHASKFRKFGVEVFKPGSKTDLDSFNNIFEKIRHSKLRMDREALIKAFGRTEGERFYQLLVMANDEYHKLIDAGKMNGVVTRDLGTYTESTAGRIDIALEKTKNAFANALTPERIDQIVGGIQRIADAMPAVMSAVGKVSDAFTAFVHATARAKAALTGGSHYQNTSDEQALLAHQDRHLGITSEEGDRRRAQIIKRNAEYNKAIDDIMGAETDFGATDESIKRAMRVALPYGADHRAMPGQAAGVAYLGERAGEISPERFKRIRAEVEKERNPQGFGYNPTEKYEMALAEQTVRRLAAAIAEAVGAAPPQVNVDGNKLNSAVHDARNGRRR